MPEELPKEKESISASHPKFETLRVLFCSFQYRDILYSSIAAITLRFPIRHLVVMSRLSIPNANGHDSGTCNSHACSATIQLYDCAGPTYLGRTADGQTSVGTNSHRLFPLLPKRFCTTIIAVSPPSTTQPPRGKRSKLPFPAHPYSNCGSCLSRRRRVQITDPEQRSSCNHHRHQHHWQKPFQLAKPLAA